MRHFNESEFPESIEHGSPELFEKLDKLRDFIKVKIFPSPAPGALARLDLESSSSQHYASKTRKSRAIDFFTSGDPFAVYLKILHSRLFRRVGVYFDTKLRGCREIMFHVDLKPQDLMWFRANGKYIYSNNPHFYRKIFKQFFLKTER